MRKRAKKKEYVSKFADEYFWVTTTVTEIIERNKEFEKGDKFRVKNVFKCASSQEGAPDRMCIYWSRCCVEVGDTVQMQGRVENGVFLVRTSKKRNYLLVIKKKEENLCNP